MIGNIALGLYITFVAVFTAIYIFVGHSEWHWTRKIIGMIVSTLVHTLVLPIICGMYIGILYVEGLRDYKKYEVIHKRVADRQAD